ncbi:MAG: DUF547 domain-containing protein [Chitinophagales bacterium]
MSATEIAQQLLFLVKTDKGYSALQAEIAQLSVDVLKKELITQEQRLAFWINLYNAFFQIKVKESPHLFNNKIKLFFGRHFTIAGHRMSLDDMEHDMLRRSTFKWSLGYIKNPFPSAFEKALQVHQLDPRIHFALNCGAVSCPPIRYYTPENVLQELDMASQNFLEQECSYDADKNVAQVTSIFSWFRGDFGGISGIKQFLAERKIVSDSTVQLQFKAYNWQQQFENYT